MLKQIYYLCWKVKNEKEQKIIKDFEYEIPFKKIDGKKINFFLIEKEPSRYTHHQIFDISTIIYEKLLKSPPKSLDILDFLHDLFKSKPVEESKTKIFKNRSNLHKNILEFIILKLDDYDIIDQHNIRDEASIDLILTETDTKFKIGIQVEVPSDIENDEITLVKNLKSQIEDSRRLNIDYFLFLFCIDLANKSHRESYKIAIGNLNQLPDYRKYFFYIDPINLVGFFKELNNNNLMID